MKNYIILVFVLPFISCQEKIEAIKVWYYNGIFNRVMAVGCDEIVYLSEKVDTMEVILEDGNYLPKEAVILESIITDKVILQEIIRELDKATIIKEDYIEDARMKCFFTYSTGRVDSLCLEGNAIRGIYNDQPVKLSNKFAYLIRNYCGFYQWMGTSIMPYFDELNDPSFERKKVISRSGETY